MTGDALYRSETEKVKLVERNLALQIQEVIRLATAWRATLQLSPQIVRDLHLLAIRDVYSCAGQFRTHAVRIEGSQHRPPRAPTVEGLVAGMCQTANEHTDWDALQTAAFLMWKVNWIHPFAGGNGRTSRALAYLGLSVRLGYIPPGESSFVELIAGCREDYIAALRDADAAWDAHSVPDTTRMQTLLDNLLTQQLESASSWTRL